MDSSTTTHDDEINFIREEMIVIERYLLDPEYADEDFEHQEEVINPAIEMWKEKVKDLIILIKDLSSDIDAVRHLYVNYYNDGVFERITIMAPIIEALPSGVVKSLMTEMIEMIIESVDKPNVITDDIAIKLVQFSNTINIIFTAIAISSYDLGRDLDDIQLAEKIITENELSMIL